MSRTQKRLSIVLLSACLLILLFTAPAFVARLHAAEDCRTTSDAVCAQYPIWHPWYWMLDCDKPECPGVT